MKVMGLKAGVNWLSWFISNLVIMFIMALIIVIFLKFGQLARYSDFGLLWCFLACFSLAVTMLWSVSLVPSLTFAHLPISSDLSLPQLPDQCLLQPHDPCLHDGHYRLPDLLPALHHLRFHGTSARLLAQSCHGEDAVCVCILRNQA